MNRQIESLFEDSVISEAARRYGVEAEAVKKLGGFESYVYEYEQAGRAYILKITHTSRRSPDYLLGELDWLNYIADRGVSAAHAVPSLAGHLVELIPAKDGDSHWLVMSYVKAPGHLIGAAEWHDDTFRKWGKQIGKMHALTKHYQVPDPRYKRIEWDKSEEYDLGRYIPESEVLFIEKAAKVMARVEALPREKDGYGLVHFDMHHGNFHVHNGEIMVFDFDDCQYSYFMYDIAICLYNTLWFPKVPLADRTAFARRYLEVFMCGYEEENHLDLKWFAHLHDFLRLRHVDLYSVFHRSWDLDHLEPWQADVMARIKREIEEELPVMGLDFDQLNGE